MKMATHHRALICGGIAAAACASSVGPAAAFVVPPLPTAVPSASQSAPSTSTSLGMGYNRYGDGRSSSRYASQNDRSKRQERVGHVVRSELATIIQKGYPIKTEDGLEDELRRRINVVNADVSPDLRQARVTVSVIGRRGGGGAEVDAGSEEMDKRRAYSWLVRNTPKVRHAMAQRLSHMKVCPELKFVRADVGAAVDVMQLIEKVSQGYKRETVGEFGGDDDTIPWTAMDWEEGDIDDEDDGWEDFDDEDEEDFDDEDEEEELDRRH